MTTITAQLTALAPLLVASANAVLEARRPVDRTRELRHLDGLADAAHALELCPTPFALKLVALDAVREAGTMPPATADNAPRRAWKAACVAAIMEATAAY